MESDIEFSHLVYVFVSFHKGSITMSEYPEFEANGPWDARLDDDSKELQHHTAAL